MMRRTSLANTRWRDSYGRVWRWALLTAVVFHAFLFLFLPRALSDRLHEALIPAPTVFVRAGSGAMEAIALAAPPPEVPPQEPPRPAEEEPVVVPVPGEEPVDVTIAETDAVPADEAGDAEGVAGATGEGDPAPGGGGSISPPRPLHLVVPRLPRGIDKKKARGESVHLLVEVLADGRVGEVRVEKGSRRVPALDVAALNAARQMRYVPAQRDGAGITQWTRAEMRF